MREMNIIKDLHTKTERNYYERMTPDKPACMRAARKFGKAFFDGDRCFGYGGYKYDGRFRPVARALIDMYGLDENSKILDFGCAKGFLMHEFTEVLILKHPCRGMDVSEYAKKSYVVEGMSEVWPDGELDLVVSLGTLHNLTLPELKVKLQLMEKTAKHKYITVDSYRNVKELFNLQCWTLTCEQFLRPHEWEFLFKEWGYTGDYEFLFFK